MIDGEEDRVSENVKGETKYFSPRVIACKIWTWTGGIPVTSYMSVRRDIRGIITGRGARHFISMEFLLFFVCLFLFLQFFA